MATTRLISTEEYPLAADFIDRYWAKGHIYARDRKLFDWTFHRPGFAPMTHYTFAIAEDAGAVIGILGGIPFTFNHMGESRRAFWLANWKVREEFRRGTVGLDLLSHFYRPAEWVTVSFGINPTVAKLYKAMRWQVMEDIPRYLGALPDARGRFARLLHIANPAWDVSRCEGLAGGFTLGDSGSASGGAKDGPPDWQDWDRASWALLKNESIGAARDGAYLSWRYGQHPKFQYRFICIPEGERMGLIVWRLETIRRNDNGQLVDLEKLGRLVEFLPASRANAQRLLSHFVLALEEVDAIGADGYLYHGRFGQYLSEAGFRRTDSHPDGAFIPSRFQPLDGAGGQIRSAVSSHTVPPPAFPYSPNSPWYWTKSDSDQDRPN